MHVIHAMMEMIKNKTPEEYIEGLLRCFAAPVIHELRCGCMLNLKKAGPEAQQTLLSAWQRGKNAILKRWSLEAVDLSAQSDASKGLVVFIYRTAALRRALSNNRALSLLKQSGYPVPHASLKELLEHLQKRFHSLKDGFPHEIGLFLGFPVEDVQGYIQHGGEHALASGYWKVYGDVQNAEAAFSRFKQAEQQEARHLLLKGGITMPSFFSDTANNLGN